MGKIQYLNTDLDLKSVEDIRPLTRSLSRKGLFTLHVDQSDDGSWFSCLATDTQYRKPNPNINAILRAVEGLGSKAHGIWKRCTLKEMNIGYECGDKPWAFNDGVTETTLRRMAKHGVSLRITIYPPFPMEESGRAVPHSE